MDFCNLLNVTCLLSVPMLANLLFSRSFIATANLTRVYNKILTSQIISNASLTKITAFQNGHVVLTSSLGDITLKHPAISIITVLKG